MRANARIETVEQVRAYAMEKYNQGGDGIIECYEDAQIQEDIIDLCKDKSVRKYLDKDFGIRLKILADREAEFESNMDEEVCSEYGIPKHTVKGSVVVEGVSLTPMQVSFLKYLMPSSLCEEEWDSRVQSDMYCEFLQNIESMNKMSAGGVISTLRHKGILVTGHDKVNGRKAAFFELTDLGKTVAQNV